MKNEEVVKVAKRTINKKRIEIQEIKSEVGKLGPKTDAFIPDDLEVMFAGKMCDMLIQSNVKSINILEAYKREYKDVAEETKKRLEFEQGEVGEAFERAKARATKIAERHPLWHKLSSIRGFSAYQLALIMCYIKDIEKFDTPSKLCVYAGVSEINGMAICKANIARIKEYYASQGKEFKGFNTILAGRMFVIVESMIKQKGYFYHMYVNIRKRLEQRCINQNQVEQNDEGKLMMKGKKNQSLILFTDKNAKRRLARTLLHLIYKEWRELKGLEVRNPYPIDYLGHNSLITLEEVVAFEEQAGITLKAEAKLKREEKAKGKGQADQDLTNEVE